MWLTQKHNGLLYSPLNARWIFFAIPSRGKCHVHSAVKWPVLPYEKKHSVLRYYHRFCTTAMRYYHRICTTTWSNINESWNIFFAIPSCGKCHVHSAVKWSVLLYENKQSVLRYYHRVCTKNVVIFTSRWIFFRHSFLWKMSRARVGKFTTYFHDTKVWKSPISWSISPSH